MTRTTGCDKATRAGRMDKAEQFYTASEIIRELVDDEELSDAYVTLCVHAGIAAADVICCAALGQHSIGQDHTEAVALLKMANQDPELPRSLAALLRVKTRAGYTSVRMSPELRKQSRRAMERLMKEARRVHS